MRLAALFHDVGKPKTRSFANGGVSFHHHEVVGARMTEERMRALKYPNDIVDDVVKLVYLHLRIHTYAMGWTDKAVRRYVRDAGRCSTSSTTCSAATARPATRTGRGRCSGAWTSSSAASPSCASRRSSTRSGRRSTAGR